MLGWLLGFGYHGDVIIAWDEGVLAQATTQCGPIGNGQPGTNGVTSDCPVFDIVPVEEQQACKIEIPPEIKDENVTGPDSALPGNVAIQSGPGYATEAKDSPPSTFGPVASSSAESTSSAAAASSSDSSSSPSGQEQVVQVVASSSPTASLSTPPSTASSSSTTIIQAARPVVPSSFSTTTSTTTTTTISTTTSAPAVVAPAADGPLALQLSTLTTTWYTNGLEAYEVVVVAEEVTVTVAAGATPAPVPKQKAKREHEHHLAGHKRHGHGRLRHQHHAGRAR